MALKKQKLEAMLGLFLVTSLPLVSYDVTDMRLKVYPRDDKSRMQVVLSRLPTCRPAPVAETICRET